MKRYPPGWAGSGWRFGLGGVGLGRRLGRLARALPERRVAGNGLPNSTQDILWRIPYGGHSTPVISDGRVFAINLCGKGITEQEQVFALDAATGKELWSYKFNCFHTDVPNSRVGWASVAVDPETGNVYANGVQGLVLCLDRDGKLLWSKSTRELFGRVCRLRRTDLHPDHRRRPRDRGLQQFQLRHRMQSGRIASWPSTRRPARSSGGARRAASRKTRPIPIPWWP